MTDLETTKPSQESDSATAALTASEGNQVTTDAPAKKEQAHTSDTAHSETTHSQFTDTADATATQSTGDALLAAIEAIVPAEAASIENTGNIAADTVVGETNAVVEAQSTEAISVEAASSESSAAEATPTVAVAAPEEATPAAESTVDTSIDANDTAPLLSAVESEAALETEAGVDTETVKVVAEEKPRIPFAFLNLDPRLQKGIDDQGFSTCTPIQSEALPHTLLHKDVIGKAQTGTGKTAAFLITIIQNLLTTPEQEERYNGEPRALILAPTRELALQIEKDARPLLKNTPLNMVSIVGGMDYKKQQKRLQEEIVDIVVGTPGRLIDFVRGKDLFLSETEIVVIDEADRMLDMGFIPDVKRLVRETPYKTYRQTLLFSATFTADIMNLSENWTTDPVRVEIEPESVANASVDQKIYIVMADQKINVLYNLITQQNLDRVMVFVNRRDETRDLTTKLKALGLRVAMLSGEIPQHKRLRTLENFRNGRLRVMVATDVAGRGIHIEGISHVVNYTLPEDPEDYVHRIGRTGRAGATGTSVSFACEEDAFLIPAIETLLGEKVLCTHPEPELLAELPELIAE